MKIGVVTTGGTIASASDKSGVLRLGDNKIPAVMDMYNAAYRTTAEFEKKEAYKLFSENLDFCYMQKLYEAVNSFVNDDTVDGIIVLHGTDTLQYTAAMLACAFGKRVKPIAVVSSNLPLSDSRANGLHNFAAAVGVIEDKAHNCGVFVPYRNAVGKTAVFDAAALKEFEVYGDDVHALENGMVCYADDNGKPTYCENYDDSGFQIEALGSPNSDNAQNVLWIRAHVGDKFNYYLRTVDAVLITAYHSGTLPTGSGRFVLFCERLKNKNIPVYLVGARDSAYDTKEAFEKLNIKQLPRISPVTAYVMLSLYKAVF